LNIQAPGGVVKIVAGGNPKAYSTGGAGIVNGGLLPEGGFVDITARNNREPQHLTFTFAPGVTVADFSLHMLDFGDWNPTRATSHSVAVTAYDANSNVVTQQVVQYTTPAVAFPTTSDLFGDLRITGDAVLSVPGDLGNWTWHLTGQGIVRVTLDVGPGQDPNLGFDTLRFTTGCP
jgi:hypothetical protein